MSEVKKDKWTEEQIQKRRERNVLWESRRKLKKEWGIDTSEDGDDLENLNLLRQVFLKQMINDCLVLASATDKNGVIESSYVKDRKEQISLIRATINMSRQSSEIIAEEAASPTSKINGTNEPREVEGNVELLEEARQAMKAAGISKKV